MNEALLIGAVAAAIAVPLFLRLFFRGAQRQMPQEREGALVFRKNTVMQCFGFAGVCLCAWPVGLFALGRGKNNNITWWVALVFGIFGLLSAFFLIIGEIWLFNDRIEKRALWLKRDIPWNAVEDLLQDRGEVTVMGANTTLKFNRYYAGSEKLISEIKKRSPKLQRTQDNPFGPPSYPWAEMK